MALHLKDLMAKAESKGIKAKDHPAPFLKPWQEESVLFNGEDINNNDQAAKKNISSQFVLSELDPPHAKETSKINRRQTGDKVETNRKQSEDKTGDKVETKWRQKKETGDKVVSQPETQPETKWRQSGDKVETNHLFSSLVGLQRSLLIFIYNECKIARSKVTNNLTLEHVCSSLHHPKSSVKTTLRRLEAKQLIQRVAYKNGRGGWFKFSLEDAVFQELLKHETEDKLRTKWRQTEDKVETQPETQPETSPLSSSSIYNNITTTTELPERWLKIDHSPLVHIGFSQQHLMQLYKTEGLNPKNLQDSIEYFSFDLSENNKASEIKTNPLGYFMGIMKRSGVYTAPENYEAPKDRAMRIYLEQQKAIKKKREVMENELLEIAFSEWKGQLSEEEKNNLLPEDIRRINLSGAKESHLRQYFHETLWATEREKRIMEFDKPEEK